MNKVVKLVGGGSIIFEATPAYTCSKGEFRLVQQMIASYPSFFYI